MIVAGSASPLLLASAAGGYNLTRSLRFRSSASAYLNRTPASAGNRKTFTFSTWLKRGSLDSFQMIFSGGDASGDNDAWLRFDSGNTLNFSNLSGGSYTAQVTTSAVFRDPSAWYHLVLAVDTTQATGTNRIKIYVNGVQQTVTFTTTPSQNSDTSINIAGLHTIGRLTYVAVQYVDGYYAETHFVDGQALTPSSFGANSATTGVWQPIRYAGTYGTNGFYLNFTDNTALTTSSNVGLGKDFSGNGNYWTTNNISLTAGSTYDSMTDVPTLTSATAANFPTINPLAATIQTLGSQVLNISQANLYVGLRNTIILSTMGGKATGKYYWEITADSNELLIGVATPQVNLNASYPRFVGNDPFSWGYYTVNGNCLNNGSVVTSTGVAATTGDVIGVALDLNNQKLFISKNGTYLNSGNPVSGSGAVFTNISNTDFVLPAISDGGGTTTNFSYHNYGQRPFTYTPPTGFVALNTFNLPTPTIGATASTQAGKYEGIVTYTGNGASSRAITGLGFQPDMVWIKRRSTSDNHVLFDSVRVVSSVPQRLFPNLTNAEDGNFGSLDSFNSDGFTIGSNVATNANGETYVGWCWRANNGTNVTNTAGSITSTVSANTSAGFSVVTYTGNGSSGATIGHGLGVAPKMVIVKKRNGADQWFTNHTSASATAGSYLKLDSTAAVVSGNADVFNNTNPSSTVVTLGTDNGTNASGGTYVAYCFSQVAGYSAFGSYTGNGSTDGPFVYTGFKPEFVMIKKTATGGGDRGWLIEDAARSPNNVSELFLYANTSDAESNNQQIDFLSNGFKIRNDGLVTNNNGITNIYMAFAESPFKYANAR